MVNVSRNPREDGALAVGSVRAAAWEPPQLEGRVVYEAWEMTQNI
jgi:hypothetical protein